MCGIAGIVSSNHRELGPLLKEMLGSMQHRGPDGAGYIIGKSLQREMKLDDLDFRSKKGKVALGHVRLAITGSSEGLQPFQSDDGKISLLHNGEIYNHHELARELDYDISEATGSDSEVLMRLIEKEYDGDLAGAVSRVIGRLDGVYAIAVTDMKQTVIARDKVGVRQLYYYRTPGLMVYASEKKPLWALGGAGAQINRVPPGHMIIITEDDYHLQPFWNPRDMLKDKFVMSSIDDAVEAYDRAIRSSIRKRVRNRDRVGIIFSGGIDSFLIAHLVKELGVPFCCYTAGREPGAVDIEWSKRVADDFGFPLRVRALSTRDIENLIPEVIRDIEDQSLNQVEVAIPIYASVRMAQEEGERVILTGQGADELFGGYAWYPKMVDIEGYDSFVRHSWEDTMLLYKECLEREDKISMAHSLELRVPYLDPEVIRVAFSIAPQLKINENGDHLGKRIHREYCRRAGVPEEIAFRIKEAAQHGANVHNVFEELADRAGLSEALMDQAGYNPDRTVSEKLGSSSRYGYRYGAKHLWKPLPHVQYYLDTQAAQLGLLPRLPRLHWELTNRKLEALGTPSRRE